MTDEGSAVLPDSSRDVDRIVDDMLTRSLRTLTFVERAMIRRANSGERSEEFVQRVELLYRTRRNQV